MSTHDSIRNAKQPDEMQYRQVRSQHKEKSSEQTEVWLKRAAPLQRLIWALKWALQRGWKSFATDLHLAAGVVDPWSLSRR